MKRTTRDSTLTLSKLRHGDRAVITHIDPADPSTTARLAARGIVPGTELGVLRAGDPVLIGIDNERWAINGNEAAHIHVDLKSAPKRSLLSRLRGR